MTAAVVVAEIVGIVLSALVAGVFFDVSIATLPAFFRMSPGDYVVASRLVGRGYHPTMPILVNLGALAQIGLLLLAPSTVAAVCFAVALGALIASQFVSHLGNMRINRRLHKLDPHRVPVDWDDPRPRWRRFHRVRLGLAGAALLANVVGAVVGG